MCGIAGIVDPSGRTEAPSVGLLRSMIGAVSHRGPDGYGYYRDLQCGMAHARLSVIDLASGQQPMGNEDGTLWIVLNGEIFNYRELRRELESIGHTFRTTSDTEVVLHAVESWGEGSFSRFNGQWALALWDTRRRELTLSRDRVGICPLFTRRVAGRVWFGSEVKSIFADRSVARAIDPRGIDQTMTYWASVAPQSVFQGIEEFPPGRVRVYGPRGIVRDSRYWQLSFSGGSAAAVASRPVRETAHTLRRKLEESTALRALRADVPVGCYISGGLDSSLVARLARESVSGRFSTFAICFDDPSFDESPYQRLMAREIGSDHIELRITPSDIARVFPEVVRHAERPLLRTAPAPMYLLSGAVRAAGIKSVLTGEGADEFFAGYDLFREAKIREFWSRDPSSRIRPLLFDRIYPYLAKSPRQGGDLARDFWRQGLDRAGRPGFSHDPRWRSTATLKRFFTAGAREAIERDPAPDILDHLPEEFSRWDVVEQAQYLEIVTLFCGYLISSQGDRMLMAHGVEGRFPFLDPEVIDFANGLPVLQKLPGLDEKRILKRAARELLPERILARKKQPYRAPDAVCFVGRDAPEYVGDALSRRSLERAGLFDPGAVEALAAKISRRLEGGDGAISNTDNMSLLGILSTQLLHAAFVESDGGAPGTPVRFGTVIDRAADAAPDIGRENL